MPESVGHSLNLFVFVVRSDSIVLYAFLFLDLYAGPWSGKMPADTDFILFGILCLILL